MIHVDSYPIEIIEVTRNYKFTDRFNIPDETNLV